MARPTREEININDLILSYKLDPDGVYHVTRYMCNRAKKEYAALMTPWTKMSEEEITGDKQEIRHQLLQIALENEDDAIKQQMVPETLIEAFVDKIIYDKGTFSWYLNSKYGNEVFDIDTTDWKKSMLNRKKNNYHSSASMVKAGWHGSISFGDV